MQEKTEKGRIFVLLFDGSKFSFQFSSKKKKIPERPLLPRIVTNRKNGICCRNIY